MPQSPVPIQTYAIAATLSLVLNAGVVGTFAMVDIGGAAPVRVARTSGAMPLVISELMPPEETPAEKPEEKPEEMPEEKPKPEAASEAEPPKPPQVEEPAPPQPEVALMEPELPEVEKPPEREVKLGNPDAPEIKTDVWLGVSMDAGVIRGPRSPIDQGDFRKGLPGDKTAEDSPTAATIEANERAAQEMLRESAAETARVVPIAPEADAARDAADSPMTPAGAEAMDAAREITADAPMNDDSEAMESKEPPALVPVTSDDFAVRLDATVERGASFAEQLREFVERAMRSATPVTASLASEAPSLAKLDQTSQSHEKPTQKQDMAPVAVPAPSPTTRSGQNGNGADRESDAFSKSDPVDVKPGQPLAGKGLAIKTVAPRFTTTTRQMIRPKNPVIRVTFGRDGKVIRAEYLPGKDAGHPDVSGPLRDAVLMWTAQGDELLTIPQGDPLAGVFIEFKVILN